MNLEFDIFTFGLLLGAAGFLMSVACFAKQRKNNALIDFWCEQVEELKKKQSADNEQLEAAARRAIDHARRIAWLETRIRQSKFAKKEVLDEMILAEKPEKLPPPPPPPNITERRHRVLHLASRGQNAEAIATTLGMLTGEVELIVNLNQANYARFS